MPEFHGGKLLVATPAITDPNFSRTVLLLCTHNEEGAFGLVLNRPMTDLKVVDQLPIWSEQVAAPAVFFRGGPVEPAAGLALGRWETVPALPDWSPVLERVAMLNISESPEEVPGRLAECRIYAGYAGWGAGQLEGEIEGGGWFVVEADPGDIFASDPDGLWRAVLSRQTGEMRLYSYFPADPRAN
ncbi:MAG: YqgE/AlgH family protein [Dehalococcoidia bacterium]